VDAQNTLNTYFLLFNQADFGKVSESIVHEEILRRGLIQSVVRYFYNQQNGNKKINLITICTF